MVFKSSILLVLLCASPALAGTFVFGDSSVEQGNLYARPGYGRPDAPYYDRDGFSRESNGPVWVEYLAPGIMPDAGAKTGSREVNFAYSGATSGSDNIAGPVEGTGFDAQVDAFQARGLAGRSGDLFAIAVGTNDFIRDLGVKDLRETSRALIGNLGNGLDRLSGLGAQRLLVEDVPNFHQAPAFADLVPPEDRERFDTVMTELLDTHRAAQLEALRAQNARLKNTDIVTVKVSRLFDYVLAHAKELGFRTVTRGCYDEATKTLCSTDRKVQNSYFFFDGLHLTEAGQRIQAAYYSALLGQLDGSAHALPKSMGRFVNDTQASLAAAARDTQVQAWAAPLPQQGFGISAQASAGSDGTRLGSLGFDWSDGVGGSVRFDLARFGGDLDGVPGHSEARGWSTIVSGERRLGNLRLGATLGLVTGSADGTRDMPVAGMSATHKSDLDGHFAELSAGTVLTQGALTILPAAWLRWSDVSVGGFTEQGKTGLEMAFDDLSSAGLTAGLGLNLRYAATDRITPWASLGYENRVAGLKGIATGRLVDNSADDIRRKVDFASAAGQIRAGVDIGLADGGLWQVSGALNSGGQAMLRSRVTWRF